MKPMRKSNIRSPACWGRLGLIQQISLEPLSSIVLDSGDIDVNEKDRSNVLIVLKG